MPSQHHLALHNDGIELTSANTGGTTTASYDDIDLISTNKYNKLPVTHTNTHTDINTITDTHKQHTTAAHTPWIVRAIENIHPKAHYGHFVLFLAPIMNVCASAGTTFGVGFYSTYLMEELQISRSVVSGSWAFALLLTSLFVPFVGRLFDRIGATLTVAIFIPLYVFDLWLFSRISSVWMMVLCMFMSRLEMSIWQLYSSYICNQWFVEHRAMAMTYVQCASTIGLCYPILLSYLTEVSGGWRQSLQVLAVLCAVVCSILCSLAVNNPERAGRLPDLKRHDTYQPVTTDDAPGNHTQITVQPASNGNTDDSGAEIHWMYEDALRTRLFWTVTTCSVIVSVLWSGYNFNYRAMWQQQGVQDDTESLYVLVTISNIAALAFAGWLFGYLVIKARGMVLGTVGCFIACLLLMTGHTYTQAQMYAVAFGVMDGIFITGYLTIFAYSFGRVNLGTIDSIASAFITIACGLGPLAFGVTEDMTGSFNIMYYVVLVISVLSTISLAFSNKPEPPPEHRRLRLSESKVQISAH